MSDAMSGTGDGLMAFLDYSHEKGLVKKNNAVAIKGACKEVLSTVYPTDWETLDMKTLDVEDVMGRFQNLRGTQYTPSSLSTYRSRLRSGASMYKEFLSQGPGSWRPAIRQQTTAAALTKATSNGKTAKSKTTGPALPAVVEQPPSSVAMIPHTFPLRKDVRVTLTLPDDLTDREAKRLGTFIASLAQDEMLALNPGRVEGT